MLKCYYDPSRHKAEFYRRIRSAITYPLVSISVLAALYSLLALEAGMTTSAIACGGAVLACGFIYALLAFLEANAPDGLKKGAIGLLILRLNPGYGWLASLHRLAHEARTRHGRWPATMRRRIEIRRGELLFSLFIKKTDSTSPFHYSVSIADNGPAYGMRTLVQGAIDLRGNIDFPDEIADEVDRKALRKLGREILSLAHTFFDDGGNSLNDNAFRLHRAIERMGRVEHCTPDMKDFLAQIVQFHGRLCDAAMQNRRFTPTRDAIGDFRRHVELGGEVPARTIGLFDFLFRRGLSIVETHLKTGADDARDIQPEVEAAMESIRRLVRNHNETMMLEQEAALRLEARAFSQAVTD